MNMITKLITVHTVPHSHRQTDCTTGRRGQGCASGQGGEGGRNQPAGAGNRSRAVLSAIGRLKR